MSISIQQWKAAFDAISEAVCLLDTQGRVLWYNGAMRKLVGKRPDDPIANVACCELLHMASWHGPTCPFARMMESRQRVSQTVPLGERWFKVIVDPLLNEKGEISGAVHVMEDVTEHRQSEEVRNERMRLTSLTADMGFALTRGGDLRQMLQQCAEHLVQHLDAAFARIWTFSGTEGILILQASAGMYTHLNGPHGRIPITSPFKIPTIARERLPILTNTVVGDPQISDQEWAIREGMVAFAGYPLIVEGELIGVMGVFARRTLTEFVLKALAAVSDVIALAVQRTWIQEELLEAKDHLENILQNAAEAIGIVDAHGRFTKWNHAAEELYGYSFGELKEKPFSDLYPDGKALADMLAQLRREGFVYGYEIDCLRKGGRVVPVRVSIRLLRDKSGKVIGSVGVTTDLTDIKQSFSQLKLANEQLQTEITEREKIAQELQEARDKLEKLVVERTEKLSRAGDLLKRSINRIKDITEE